MLFKNELVPIYKNSKEKTDLEGKAILLRFKKRFPDLGELWIVRFPNNDKIGNVERMVYP